MLGMPTGLLFLLGYLVFILVAVWGIERFLSAVTMPQGPFGAPSAPGTGRRCDRCGIRLMPHEGPNDYGYGPVWECDGCMGLTN